MKEYERSPYRRRMREAISMFDDGDERSFNDIYGEEGIPLEDDTEQPIDSVTVTLTSDQVAALRAILAQVDPVSDGVPGEEDVDANAEGAAALMERRNARRGYGRV